MPNLENLINFTLEIQYDSMMEGIDNILENSKTKIELMASQIITNFQNELGYLLWITYFGNNKEDKDECDSK